MLKTVVILCLALTQVLPVAARPQILRRGLAGAVYTCTSPDFRDECQWSPPSDRCKILGGNGIKSLGPDPEGYCSLYKDYNCSGEEVQKVVFPGLANGLPQFKSFQCFSNGQGPAANTASTSATKSNVAEAMDTSADPRLAGGTGSLERENNLEEIQAMEEGGFKEGLIGLKKDVYY